MPNKSKHDLEFRPESYFEISDAKSEIFARVKGDQRRLLAKEMDESGEIENLERLNIGDIQGEKEEIALVEELTDDERDLAGSLHPKMMGGEYLPTLRGYGMEIARVSLDSTTGDVFSIRAQSKGEMIHYKIVSEYEDDEDFPEIEFQPKESKLPLTTGELISLIDSVKFVGEDDYGKGLTNSFRDRQFVDNANPDELANFVIVTSELYPDLEGYYREEAKEWLEKAKAKRAINPNDSN